MYSRHRRLIDPVTSSSLFVRAWRFHLGKLNSSKGDAQRTRILELRILLLRHEGSGRQFELYDIEIALKAEHDITCDTRGDGYDDVGITIDRNNQLPTVTELTANIHYTRRERKTYIRRMLGIDENAPQT